MATKGRSRKQRNTVSEHPTTRHARDVVEGRFLAGPIVRDACRRHLVDLKEGRKRGLVFDEVRANRALEFFPDVLRLNGGQFEGKPFELHASQQFIVGSLFGWTNRAKGTRRFRVAYVEEGKGNGKSPLAAGIGLYGMVADGEERAEIYSAATKKDQAMVLFRDAVAMVDQSPDLLSALRRSGRGDKVWNLYHSRSSSFFRPIAADGAQSGPRPHFGLIDELHEHPSANVINIMDAGKKFRRQPLLFIITNSGHNRQSVCWEYHEMARRVCAGEIVDDTLFAYVCGLDEGEDPFKDEKCWPKANPLLGHTIDEKYLRDLVVAATGLPSKEADVRRLNFCEWTEAKNPLLSVELWDKAEASFTLEKVRGAQVWIGIDLSSTQDLTAAVIVARRGDRFWWFPMFWMPREIVREKSKKDKVPYDVWIKKGWVRTTPGKAINKDFVVSDIAGTVDKYGLSIVASPYDRWRIEELKAAQDREGVDLVLEPHGQGFAGMATAIDAVEVALANDQIRHNGNPCMRMCVANAIAATDPAGNRKFDKERASGRIDGIVAGAMAQGRAVSNNEPDIGDFLREPVIA